ncbi:hypothetical protein [Streptomyces arboris]|uniref:Uncharacterized protein n=1 Tax=Streptomyces arboris TaxID=2600619 RepID=A0A5N5ESV4_9ACTN|nr:hypothetical protein F5983_15135 [Streptomyces arboris]
MRDAFGKVDAAALAQAGFARLAAPAPASSGEQNPDGVREREQRRAHVPPAARKARPGHCAAGRSRWTARACAKRSVPTEAVGSSCRQYAVTFAENAGQVSVTMPPPS